MIVTFNAGLDLAQACATASWWRMRRLLFEPFSLQKWLILGFAAWLANLGQSGGAFNFHVPGPHGSGSGSDKVQAILQSAVQYCRDHLAVVLAVGALVAVLLLALAILVAWVSSRGRFVFLDCVARDHLQIREPWAAYREEAASLFWWRLAFGAILGVLVVGLAGSAVALFFFTSWMLLPKIVLLTVMGVLAILLLLAAWVIGRLLDDWVVPCMYKERLNVCAAWTWTGRRLRLSWPAVAAYLLLYIALSIVAGVAVVALILCTCCVAGCLMLVPFIGTVVLLPVSVFFRLYSLYFFQGMVPEAQLLAEATPAQGVPGDATGGSYREG